MQEFFFHKIMFYRVHLIKIRFMPLWHGWAFQNIRQNLYDRYLLQGPRGYNNGFMKNGHIIYYWTPNLLVIIFFFFKDYGIKVNY